MDERRQSDFITEKRSVQHMWGENRKKALGFLEDVNQPTPRLLSENCDSFISGNVISLLNIDQQRIKNTFDKCGYDSMGDTCAITSSDKSSSTDGCIESIFTDPGLNFTNSTFTTSYPEECCPHRSHQEDSSNERSALNTSSEGCYPASSQKKGGYYMWKHNGLLFFFFQILYVCAFMYLCMYWRNMKLKIEWHSIIVM